MRDLSHLDKFECVPRFAGSVFYPGGFPVTASSSYFGDQTAIEIFYREEILPPTWTKLEIVFLQQYMIYFLSAPRWQTTEAFHQDLIALSQKDFTEVVEIMNLWEAALEFELDPF